MRFTLFCLGATFTSAIFTTSMIPLLPSTGNRQNTISRNAAAAAAAAASASNEAAHIIADGWNNEDDDEDDDERNMNNNNMDEDVEVDL